MTIFVANVTPPFRSKELVKTGVHCVNASVTSAVSSNTKLPFAGPLVAVRVSVGPLTAMLVMVGTERTVPVTSRT